MKNIKFLLASGLIITFMAALFSCQQEEVAPIPTSPDQLSTKSDGFTQVNVLISLNIPEGHEEYFLYPCLGYLYSQYEEKTYIDHVANGRLAGATRAKPGTLYSIYMSRSKTWDSWNGTCLIPVNFTITSGDHKETRPFGTIQYASDPQTGDLDYYALFNVPYGLTTDCKVVINYTISK